MTIRTRLAAALASLILALAACAGLEIEVDGELGAPEGITTPGDREPTGDPTVEAPSEVGQDLEVPLDIVEGPEGTILAFVPVEIHGTGPYAFALDTGASSSVVASEIAEELDLEVVGSQQGVEGVTGSAEAVQVQISDWEMGTFDLGARPVISLELGRGPRGGGLEGLLGSDVLSQFGAVTVDYDAGILRLRPSKG